MLSPRLQMKVAQKQILTPGLVQMVTILQLNRLELKEMINQEMVDNPVLEESLDGSQEISPEELQPLLEAERASEPADREMLEATDPDAPLDVTRKLEAHMPSDRPGMIMRRRLLRLLKEHGEEEVTQAPELITWSDAPSLVPDI